MGRACGALRSGKWNLVKRCVTRDVTVGRAPHMGDVDGILTQPGYFNLQGLCPVCLIDENHLWTVQSFVGHDELHRRPHAR
ncbi:hypothetical protein PTKU64_17650 [Paraburkholderia terrae]|uniref:Uncharacterized protein n=1 Tax=Paraburkholderia terrae TaxID=311230 RepID=A0ABM7TJ45_9BURK|nr:hypothetical protein PTKU64_17650 [Paraburkholderia terrae]